MTLQMTSSGFVVWKCCSAYLKLKERMSAWLKASSPESKNVNFKNGWDETQYPEYWWHSDVPIKILLSSMTVATESLVSVV